jgi:hypothetical protein
MMRNALPKRKQMKRILFVSFLLFMLVPSQAHASETLIGENITTTYLFPDTGSILGTPVSTTVPGSITNFETFVDIAFSANNILITTDRSGGPNSVLFDGFEFSDPNAIFATVTLDPSTTYPGLSSSDITFNANQIFVNVAGLTAGGSGETISLDIGVTPEPPSLLLFGTGLLVFCTVRRKSFAT